MVVEAPTRDHFDFEFIFSTQMQQDQKVYFHWDVIVLIA